MENDTVMEAFKADALGFVDDVIKDYRNGKGALHIGASMVLFHAIRYGDIKPINRFIGVLGGESTEGKKFKVWAGNLARVDDDGEKIATLGYSAKENVFVIRKGTGNLRGMIFAEGVEALIEESEHFLDFKKPKAEPKSKDLEKILKSLRSALKAAETQANESGVILPNDIKNMIEADKTKLAMFIEA